MTYQISRLSLVLIVLSSIQTLSAQTRNLYIEGTGDQLGVIHTTSTGSSISGIELLRGNAFNSTDWRIINSAGNLSFWDATNNFGTAGTENIRIGSSGTMTLLQGSDAVLGNGTGILVLGDPSGVNLALDDNGIIARNGVLADQLLLQTGPGMGDTYLNNLSGNVGIGTIAPGGKTEIYYNSLGQDPHLLINEDTNNGYGRIHFKSRSSQDFWELAGATGSTDEIKLRFNDGTIGIDYFELTPDRTTMYTDVTIDDIGVSSLDFAVSGSASARIFAFGDGSLVHNANNSIQLRTDNDNSHQLLLNNQGDVYLGQDPELGDVRLSAKMEIYHDSGNGDPHIELDEADVNGLARIKFRSNSSSDYWHVAAATGSTDDFRVYYNDGSSGTNLMTIHAANNRRTMFATDVYPTNGNFDLGAQFVSFAWDDCVADDFINFSDVRLKKNIVNLSDNTLQELMRLRPVTYEYLESHNKDRRSRVGLIAQEVRKVFPNVVIDEDVDFDDNLKKRTVQKSEYLAMNYIELIPITIKALQELNQKIEENKQLKSRIEKLEAAVFGN